MAEEIARTQVGGIAIAQTEGIASVQLEDIAKAQARETATAHTREISKASREVTSKAQVEDAKPSPYPVTRKKPGRKAKIINKGGPINNVATSSYTRPGDLFKKLREARCAKDVKKIAKAPRRLIAPTTISQTQAVNFVEIQSHENDTLPDPLDDEINIDWNNITDEDLQSVENLYFRPEEFYEDGDGFLYLK